MPRTARRSRPSRKHIRQVDPLRDSPSRVTAFSPVTITRPDGSTEIQPARLTTEERRAARERMAASRGHVITPLRTSRGYAWHCSCGVRNGGPLSVERLPGTYEKHYRDVL